MKTELIYPKIPENSNGALDKCIAFEKYDGTNLHWCWNRHDGWWRFGTRRSQYSFNRMGISEFQEEHSQLTNSTFLFNENLRDKLTVFLHHHKTYSHQNIIVFTEFYGPGSFAGAHDSEDQKHDEQELVLIDVMVNGVLVPPETLLKEFQAFSLARVVYMGKYTGQFTEDVRKGKYQINEGVVCKGIVEGEVFMTKVKTQDYLKRLQQK